MSENQSALEARYGRTQRNNRDRWILRTLGIVVGIVVVAWVIWVAFDGTRPSLEARDTAHKVIDDYTVSVSFQLSVGEGNTTYCAVEALNENFAVVGYKVIEVPPSRTYTRSITETLRTTERANTGLIKSCWLT